MFLLYFLNLGKKKKKREIKLSGQDLTPILYQEGCFCIRTLYHELADRPGTLLLEMSESRVVVVGRVVAIFKQLNQFDLLANITVTEHFTSFKNKVKSLEKERCNIHFRKKYNSAFAFESVVLQVSSAPKLTVNGVSIK